MHLEEIDRLDRMQVHARASVAARGFLTRLTKISSSELCSVRRSLNSIPSSAKRFSSAAMPVSSAWASKV
ncbi:hypothetical protein D3C71_2148230 [compost metagenome]